MDLAIFRIIRVKSKLFDPNDDTHNNVLVLMDVCGMICEIQLMMHEHAMIKLEMQTL